jgi:integrase
MIAAMAYPSGLPASGWTRAFRHQATLIYRRTGNLRAVQLLLGHTKIESTVRYVIVDGVGEDGSALVRGAQARRPAQWGMGGAGRPAKIGD